MSKKQTPIEILLFGLLLLVLFAYFNHEGGWNENSRISLIFAWVEEGRTEIDSYHASLDTGTGDKAYYNGHYYSDKAIGSAVVGILFYYPIHWLMEVGQSPLQIWLLRYILTFLVVGFPGALTGMLLHHLCLQVASERLVAPRLPAFLAAAGIVLATMYFPFSMIFFSHVLAAAFLFVPFYILYQIKTGSASARMGNTFMIGLLLGMAIITEYTVSILVLALVAYYFYVVWFKVGVRKTWSWLAPALGGLLPIALQLAYNVRCFDTMFVTGYTYHANEYFRQQMAEGFMGIHMPSLKVLVYLTIHPAQGIFWQSPVLLLAPFGLVGMWRSRAHRTEAALATFIAFTMLLINSGYYMWWGGDSFAPRHLVPMLPFLALPLLFIPKKLFWPGLVLGIASLLSMLLVAIVRVDVPDNLLEHIDQMGFFDYSTIYTFVWSEFTQGHFAWNMGRMLKLPEMVSFVPALVILFVGLAAILLITYRADKNAKANVAI